MEKFNVEFLDNLVKDMLIDFEKDTENGKACLSSIQKKFIKSLTIHHYTLEEVRNVSSYICNIIDKYENYF